MTRSAAIAQVRRTISAYRDKVHEVRNDTEYLPPEGARIVNEYCLDRNDEQTLVQDAIWDSSFLEGMDDGLLLEYCAVCKELDDALGLGSWNIGSVERIVRGVADLSYSEKIRRAIGYSDVLNEILEEVGDINALVKQMAVVSGGLIVLSFTGLGTVAEALGLALLLVGASFSGTELLAGIVGLVKFFTEVYNAKTEEDLKDCGKLFGDAVAKIGVNGLFFVLSLFGLKKASARLTAKTIADSNPNSGKWTWKSFKENVLKIGEEKYDAVKIQKNCYSWKDGIETDRKYLGTGRVGDFSDLKGKPIEEVLTRIPSEAIRRELVPKVGKVMEGFEYKWVQNGKTYRARIHGIDASAPEGSNAAKGWILRIQEGKKYLDPVSLEFQKQGIANIDSPYYNEKIANRTHIPVKEPAR